MPVRVVVAAAAIRLMLLCGRVTGIRTARNLEEDGVLELQEASSPPS